MEIADWFFRCLVLAVLSAILSAACWLLWLATPLTFCALAGFAGVALGIAVFNIAEMRRLWHRNKMSRFQATVAHDLVDQRQHELTGTQVSTEGSK